MPTSDEAAWGATLDEMERHLAAVDGALAGVTAYPGSFTTPVPNVPLPRGLRARARTLLHRQRDAEVGLRSRLEVLGSFMYSDVRGADPTGVSIDVRS
jgi:hypothetical protein